MSPIIDVAIIGSGPAGGACAYHLARRGRRVLVLEKAVLPRVKPCGGGVSPQVADWFDFSFDPVISARVTQIRFTFRHGDPSLRHFDFGSVLGGYQWNFPKAGGQSIGSGVLAAEAFERALAGDAEALPGYSAAIQATLGGEFAWARRLARVFYRIPALSYRVAIKHPRGPLRMAQIIAGERTYAEVAKSALAKLGF